MKINLEIENLSKSPIEKIPFEKIAKAVLEERASFLRDKSVFIEVTWVDKDDIRKLNKKHREKNESTDILSFSEYESLQEIKEDEEPEIFLGELILCYDDIEQYAFQKGLNFREEVIQVFVHGILHLLGFSHGKEMFDLQKKLIKSFF